MNSTEIFYNNGQFNWDAINTISNIILVLALVCITAWYTNEVRKQTRLIIKDRERTKILEEVQKVLTPAINLIEFEISAIQNKKILWHRYTSGTCGFKHGLWRLFYSEQHGNIQHLFDGTCGWALKDVSNKSPNLDSMFSHHDSLIDELNQFYEEIEKEIKTPELEERLEKMTREFNKGKSAMHRLTGGYITHVFGYYSERIINFEDTIKFSLDNDAKPDIDFWKENKNELLKFRDKRRTVEIHKQLSKKLIELEELDMRLSKKLSEKREKYRKEYNFTNNEINPFRGKGVQSY